MPAQRPARPRTLIAAAAHVLTSAALVATLAAALIAGPAAAAHADSLEHARVHWVDRETLVWPGADPSHRYHLHASPEAGLAVTGGRARGGAALALEASPEPYAPDPARPFAHLAGATVLRLPAMDDPEQRTLLRKQLAVTAETPDGRPVAVTGVQLPGVIDDLYRYDGPLGVTFEDGRPVFRLWAPTARSVRLLRYADADPETDPVRNVMELDDRTGVWRLDGEPGWDRQFYLYELRVYTPSTGRMETTRVTDPYALSLAANSRRSQVVDLGAPDLAPPGWATLTKPAFSAPEDMVIYELHVRDFSIHDETVPGADRGTFRAFTHADTLGMRHLARLQRAGMSHVHLLPVFDIATVPERRSEQATIDRQRLAAYPPDSPEPQAAIMAIQETDGFNWGYDPFHYTVPEGSYATDPEGTPRIVEFREMVAALNRAGLRVVMDVVYNHTHAAGLAEASVLDRVVPGYYQRLDADGRVETSTCCANTATEHRMMEKLMIDSVLTWAKAYKVDGFRFDLMGHHSRENMVKLRAALDALTPEADGVDGKAIYLYGEGWNFGEVANDARFVQARQGRLAGTGIGTFSDRLRDGARGGGHDSDLRTQGFVNGLLTDPTPWTTANGPDRAHALETFDWIRIGLAGDVADFSFQTADGETRTAADVDYAGSPAGYTADPAENIAYVAAHDNETLFDINQVRLPRQTTMAERVKVQTLASALALLGQGVPFIHAGQEFIRSKSLDRDSFNSGDWFNAIDWTFEDGNWGRGLPVANRNEANWPIMAPVLADPALAPTAADRNAAVDAFESLLRIRASTPLFRLRTGEDVRTRVRFHNTGPGQVPGLIAMSIADPGGSLGGPFSHVLVLFNARPEPVAFEAPDLPGARFRPHPEQDGLPGVFAEGAQLHAPARTAAVFVTPARD